MKLPLDVLAARWPRHTMTSMNGNPLHLHLNPHITTNYAVVLTALYLVMTLRVVYLRRSLKIAFGTEGSQSLMRTVRAHANFSEYAPLSLLLLLLLEVTGLPNLALHALGALLLVGRVTHAVGLTGRAKLRVVGMVLTLSTLLLQIFFLLWLQR